MSDKAGFFESENARLRALLRQAGLDATASDVANNLQHLLLSEMHHRIKNMLAMVQSLVVQTLRSAETPMEVVEAVTGRIMALARTHDIILSTDEHGSSLKRLLEELTIPFGQSRFQIDLPLVDISSRTAVALALVINELATNAVKYGALSLPKGGVVISGARDAVGNELVMTWTEVGGPPVREPAIRSFGTQLIQVALPSEPLLEFRPDGVYCEMKVPLPRIDAKTSD